MCPDAPARASAVNTNTQQLVNWTQQKIGTVGDANVTVASTAKVQFGSTTRQMIDLWGSSYGVGVQNSAAYFPTADHFYWYRGGTHNNALGNSGGGQLLMNLNSLGQLNVTGNVDASSFNGLQLMEVVSRACSTATCTATCPGGRVVKEAWGFHGFNGNAQDLPVQAAGWACGGGLAWLGSCLGTTSCTVTTGCPSSSVRLICG